MIFQTQNRDLIETRKTIFSWRNNPIPNQIFFSPPSHCLLRIYLDTEDRRVLVIVSELATNQGENIFKQIRLPQLSLQLETKREQYARLVEQMRHRQQ